MLFEAVVAYMCPIFSKSHWRPSQDTKLTLIQLIKYLHMIYVHKFWQQWIFLYTLLYMHHLNKGVRYHTGPEGLRFLEAEAGQ